ncbi:selenium cofactor biosynthesis protein YqeC [Collinsella aerofaciens]|uniref:selenium cofactor biosynthesis protein YqeC n=1 Tax=Collinsella aerofaciens TaxID=74426 RepID=UPI001897C60B|nr:selenium cofactor biosynthesis protein YqeC [Collinsella aerofaciens]MDB1864560.1 selenium cofactor biosynthesis protein YqeC [Collinsella aerofaciens]
METTSGNLASALKIEPGITAIIGSGGKSTLLKTLGLELMRAGGRVLLCTTTHMFPVAGVPWDGSNRRLDAAPWKPGAAHVPGCTCKVCAGMSRGSICQAGVLDPETGKLSAPAEPLGELARRFNYVLAEADGSKQLPLKAHAAWEPVIPAATANVVWVVGASGLGKPVAEVVHRPELFCERCDCEPTDIATPERVAQVLNAEMQMLNLNNARIMLNQVDTLADSTIADRFQAALGRPVVATNLK